MKERIRQRAAELGFDACGFATAAPPITANALQNWLTAGHQGEMIWLARNAHKRVDPQLVLPGVKTVIVLGVSYGETQSQLSNGASDHPESGTSNLKTGVVARFARHADYHDVLDTQLKKLATFVDALGGPNARSLWYVDTGPLLEREFAERAGIGFVGKHTNVISRRFGNWILLSEVLTTLELEPDAAEHNRCGTCTRCLDVCPTRAITAPFHLDARRCISYLTIELKGTIPVELRSAIGNRVFGCDDCLAVCPWNRFAREGRLMQASAKPALGKLDLIGLLALDDAEFKELFADTPLHRLKLRGLRRNACVVLGNVGDATCLPALHTAAAGADEVVAEHAHSAIEQVSGRQGSPT